MLATLAEYEGKGFGTAALKVALLDMKEHYLSPYVRVLADKFEDRVGRSAVTYWTKMGFTFSNRDKVVRKEGDNESVCMWMEADIDEVLARIGDYGAIACIIDAGSYSNIFIFVMNFMPGIIMLSKTFQDLVMLILQNSNMEEQGRH